MNPTRTAAVLWILAITIFCSPGCSRIQPVTTEAPLPMPPDTAEQALPLAEPLTEPQAAYYTHTIRWPGENLIRIARWYTGSGKNWIRIVEANPTVDHRRLEIGEPILIPMELIKNREPMPAAYRMPVSPQKKEPSPAPSPQTSPKIVEDELFGPIDSQSESNAPKRKDIPPALETIE